MLKTNLIFLLFRRLVEKLVVENRLQKVLIPVS